MRTRRTSLPDNLDQELLVGIGGNRPKPSPPPLTANSNRTATIQDLHDILKMKPERPVPRKVGFAQQNIQFARENSLLKVKITELEHKLNDLLKDNLQLRHNNATNKLKYEQNLNEQITLLENGVYQRFDEIILMFDNIRKREGLPSNNSPQSVRYHHHHHHHQIQSLTSTVPPKVTMTSTKKRNRRKSMFIQSDDLPNLDNEKQETIQTSSLSETIINESSIPILEHPDNSSQSQIPTTDTSDVHPDKSFKENDTTTTSVLDYSIPEEEGDEYTEEEVNIIKHNSTPRINKKEITLPSPKTSSQKDTTEKKKRLPPRPAKIPPRIRKTKINPISKDDVMPQTSTATLASNIDIKNIKTSETKPVITLQEPVIEGRALRRSTRGKAVNYKLPSLRAKMRRPQKELVDATTVNDIHEYEVNNNSIVKIEEKTSINYDTTPTETLKKRNTRKPRKSISTTAQQNISNKSDIKDDDPPKGSTLNLSSTENEKEIPLKKVNIEKPKKNTSIYNDCTTAPLDIFSENDSSQDHHLTNSSNTHNTKLTKKRSFNSILDTSDDEDGNNELTSQRNITRQEQSERRSLKTNINTNVISSSSLVQNNHTSSNNNSSSQILSDITNKPSQKKTSTKNPKRRLLKTAIVNDLYNDAEDLDIYDSLHKNSPSPTSSASSTASFRSLSSSFHYPTNTNDNAKNKNERDNDNKTVSFRFSDDDLSVFDLVNKKNANKRTKAKEVTK